MAEPSPTRPGRIFISYRREESAYPAGWLYDRLVDRFGGNQVFKDVDSIQLGDDFSEVIAAAVGSCDVLLALIGETWSSITDEHGRRRIDDPDDLVRLEIEAAMARQVRVIPILVDGARMPNAEELPESMVRLVRRQALELNPSRFDADLSRLIGAVDRTLAEAHAAEGDRSAEGVPEAGAAEPTAQGQAVGPSSTHGTVRAVAMTGAGEPGRATASAGEATSADLAARGGSAGGEARRPPTRSGPSRWRIVAGVVGIGAALILAVVVVATLVGDSDDSTSPDTGGVDEAGATPAGGVEVDTRPDTSSDGLTVSGLDFRSRNDPPLVGDTATVSYTLTNDGDEEVTLDYTFVGARNADDENVDAEDENEGAVLAPGASIEAEGRVIIDQAGTWQFWPCYALDGGTLCPDRWRVITVLVPES